MASFDIVVKKLATDAKYKELFDLAESIWQRVFVANAKKVVFGKYDEPEIFEDCKKFRNEIKRLGFPAPDGDDALYNLIIRPLMIFKINRAV